MQDGLSKNLRSPDKGVLCPFGPLGADYRESESRKGSGKATFAYRFVNCNEISVINQRFLNLCFRAGFVIDGFYEECFKNNKEIPMVMIVRLKKVKRDSLK